MRTLFCLAFAALLSLSALAQSGPPALCKPCLFYGGDYDQGDPNSAALDDENTIAFPQTSTYAAVRVPSRFGVLIEGMLFQIQFDGPVKLDPNGVTWEIRSGVSEGNGGTLVASGQGFAELQATGRGGNGPEYTVAVKVNPPVNLAAGGVYWFNITPPCVNSHDPSCDIASSGVSNTIHQNNSLNGWLQIAGQMYVNSTAFLWDWKNWCDLANPEQCGRASFGLMGKVVQ